ncbi:MAG: metalloregulator ArsR/SmtB family transcription factor [archaeon]
MKYELRIFRALSDQTRLKIVIFLLDGEKCVCEIIPHTKRKQSAVSIQLKKLVGWGILKSRRDGKKILYSISDYNVCEIFKVLGNRDVKYLENCCCTGKK